MTTTEAAKKFGVCKTTIMKWIQKGKLKAHKVNGVFFIPPNAEKPEPIPMELRKNARPKIQRNIYKDLSEQEKRDMLWDNQSKGREMPLYWFAEAFEMTVDDVRTMYDEEMRKRLGGDGM